MPRPMLTIERTDGSMAPVEAQYNPAELSLGKSLQFAEIGIPGLDMPVVQFVRGQTETLSLELFFDTTEAGTPVTRRTDAVYQLAKIDGATHAPPICEVSWGGDFPGAHLSGRWTRQGRQKFACVVESVRQRFTLFSEQGVPLRAVLSVTLREYKTLATQIETIGFLSADHTRSHVVQERDTLSRIAWEAYDDPAAWRTIADHNRIADPLDLEPGRVLELPPLP
jgi:nucleoid-associated protein YgaU